MPPNVASSSLFSGLFELETGARIFSDRNYLQACLDVEIALARAQAGMGMIPETVPGALEAIGGVDALDLERLAARTRVVGYPILPLVEEIVRLAPDRLGEYAHWGATTQDIMDTAMVLQLREALDAVAERVAAINAALESLSRTHRDTPIAGRTHLQHALPVTFGYKTAVWLAAMRRNAARLTELRPRVEVVQFSGAAGTLASLGADGLAVQAALARELGLGEPEITWHSARDAVAESVCVLGIIGGTLAKIATDVMLMMQTEIGEVFEPFEHGRGASSTMPQKRNPIACEVILGSSAAVRQQVALVLGAMAADHERATGPWHAEWLAVPEAFALSLGALTHARSMLSGLVVDTERMRANLDATGGLIVAEAVMMALAPHIGRQRAHDVVYDACRAALEPNGDFLSAARAEPEITDHLDDAELARLTDPANYVGLAGEMVDRVLNGR